MASLLKFMQADGYPADLGVCKGLALMAQRALEYKQYEKFEARIRFINGLKDEDNLRSLIQAAQKRDKNKQPRQPNDDILLSIDPFFFQVWFHFRPQAIKTFLKLPGPFLPQSKFNIAENLIYQDEPLSVPHNYFLSINKNSNDDRSTLMNFFNTIEAANESIGMVIESSNHAIHVFYDAAKKNWKVTDHSRLSESPSIGALLPSLMKIFTTNSIANLSISVFSKVPSSKLQKICKDSLTSLCDSKEINRTDSFGATPLLLAAGLGYKDVVNDLLAKNASVDEARQDGLPPLYAAAENGHTHIVEALLSKGASVDLANQGIPTFIYSCTKWPCWCGRGFITQRCFYRFG